MTFPNPDLRATCQRFLSGHPSRNQRAWLEYLTTSSMADSPMDVYGEGKAIALLEQEVAALLGKEAAVFVHKGVVAQLMALRVWTERTGRRTVALHPKSHIAMDERNSYERVHQFSGLRVGEDHRPFMLQELKDLHEPCGAIVVELPLRRAGFKLPSWEELTAISAWAHEQGVPLHFDGARLWESAPFYGRSYAEIAALADSVYVSFYKGLGGLAGCVLAGTKDFIEETRAWGDRLSGNLYTAFPYVIAAYEGLHHHLPKMAGYVARAQEIAAALRELPGVLVVPDPPQTNSFQIYLPAASQALQKAAERLAETEQTWLFNMLKETTFPSLTMSEIAVGESAERWTTEEMVASVQTLLRYAEESE
jgi:threonine aldolase